MELSLGALVVPVALYLGAPGPAVTNYEHGLFCDSVALVENVVTAADRGGDPRRAVEAINRTLGRNACYYTIHPNMLTGIGTFERPVFANHTTYGIYRVNVTAIGHQSTEIGNIEWRYSSPRVMYTLRAAPAAQAVNH